MKYALFLFTLLMILFSLTFSISFSSGSTVEMKNVYALPHRIEGDIYYSNTGITPITCTLKFFYLTDPPTNIYTYNINSYTFDPSTSGTEHFTWHYPDHDKGVKYYLPSLECSDGTETLSESYYAEELPLTVIGIILIISGLVVLNKQTPWNTAGFLPLAVGTYLSFHSHYWLLLIPAVLLGSLIVLFKEQFKQI